MIALLWAGVGCTSSDGTKDGSFDSGDRFGKCDRDVGTADMSTSPELDQLIAMYVASAGVTWSATLPCDDGRDRSVTVSYTAVDRSGIHVTERVTEPDGGHTMCGWGSAETPVITGGDTLSWSGTTAFLLGTSEGDLRNLMFVEPEGRRTATSPTGPDAGVRLIFYQDPGAAAPVATLELVANLPEDRWKCTGGLVAP